MRNYDKNECKHLHEPESRKLQNGTEENKKETKNLLKEIKSNIPVTCT